MPLPVAIIDTLAFGGNGVCRIDGKVCFVLFSCPGDEVSLCITAQKKSFSTASIATVISPSPQRTVPVCALFGECGGCTWQHISYPAQLEAKRKILAESLWRGARVPAEVVSDVSAAPLQYGYRSRLQFKVSAANGTLRIGFYRQGSHQVVDATGGCPIALPVINQVLERFRSVLPTYSAVASITQLSIDAGDAGVIVIIHHDGIITAKNRAFFADKRGDFWPCTGLYTKDDSQGQRVKLWGSTELSYQMNSVIPGMNPVVLSYPPGGFAQVNQLQNNAMLSIVRELGAFTGSQRILDLYCGNGNFSLPLAAEVASVIGIEENSASIAAAEQNRDRNEIANAQFFCEDVAVTLRRFVDQKLRFDTVILDPPRAGASDAVRGIALLQPEKIVYISCDPSTLARDCGVLSSLGYAVARSVPLDMFPQTYHIESITLLTKN